MRAWGNLTEQFIDALRCKGPLTQSEIARVVGVSPHRLSPIVQRLRVTKGGPRSAPKRIYKQRWVYGVAGTKNHLRPVWALGSLPDAPKPMSKEALAAQRRKGETETN